MAEGTDRSRLPAAAALAAVAAAFAFRFRDFLAGGTLYRRDAGFFFLPWRSVFARLLARGEWPLWNDWMSGGRPLAADPNAAAFWPLSPLLLLISPTGLAFLNLFLVVVLFFLALRRLGVSAPGAAAGTLVLLFSGVFQSLPVFFGMAAALAPLPLALAEVPRLASEDARTRRRAVAVSSLAFGLSALGGEPAVTLVGAAGFAALAVGTRRVRLAFPGSLLALALGAGIAAVQVLPAAAELARSARGGLTPAHGALFWSVRPSRLLTLLEPRLTGDPVAGPFWGSATFDASGPYFDDLALGVLPLAFAAAALCDRRGRAALALSGGAVLLSFGRFLPGYGFLAKALPFVRSPEKWWVLATAALAAAAAIGVDAVFFGEAGVRENARKVLLRTAGGMAVVCGALLGSCFGAEEFLRRVLWEVGLGAGGATGAQVSGVLRMPLLTATTSLLVCSALATRSGALFTFKEKLPGPRFAMAVLALLFLADAARRVAGTCPAGPHDLYSKEPADVALAREQAGDGRFYDDGADDRATAERRTRDAGGLDPLRPETGTVFGLRYEGENDVDRMTSAAAVRWAAAAASLPWGDEKARLLRAAGVSLVRTAAPAPDPAGTEEVGRTGSDRLVRIAGARPEFAILPEGEGGAATVLERRAAHARLRVDVPGPAATLWIGRTFDPNWRARLDGHDLPLRASVSHGLEADLPRGVHEIDLRYRNPLFGAGAAITFASLSGLVLLLWKGRPT